MTLRGGRYDNFCQQVAGIGIVTINTATSPLSHPKVVVAIYRHSIRGTGASGIFTLRHRTICHRSYRHTGNGNDLTGRCVVVIHVFLVGGPYDPIGDRNFCQLCFDGSVCPYTIKAGSPLGAPNPMVPIHKRPDGSHFPSLQRIFPLLSGIGAMDVVFPSVRFTRMISFCKATNYRTVRFRYYGRDHAVELP